MSHQFARWRCHRSLSAKFRFAARLCLACGAAIVATLFAPGNIPCLAQGKPRNPLPQKERINGHKVVLDGLKTYLAYSEFDPATLHGFDWPHDPAGLYAMFFDSALAYYAYSGDSVVLGGTREMLDYQLSHGTTPSGWDRANVPYASSDAGALEYFGADDVYYCGKEGRTPGACGVGDGHHAVEPDKVGELGLGYLKFFELTGEAKYRDATIACAAALDSHVRAGDLTHSPWPFRVFAHTNVVHEEYGGDAIGPIKLFDELIRLRLGDVAALRRARKLAGDWMTSFPMKNNLWGAYFEDVSFDRNLENWNQCCALETARYLLLHPETDPPTAKNCPDATTSKRRAGRSTARACCTFVTWART